MKRTVIWGIGKKGGGQILKDILSIEYDIIAYCDKYKSAYIKSINELDVLSVDETL